MGQTVSSDRNRKSRAPQPKWNWNFSSGRPVPKYRARAQPNRPLFKRQPSDDYNWWIGNPEPRRPKRNTSR